MRNAMPKESQAREYPPNGKNLGLYSDIWPTLINYYNRDCKPILNCQSRGYFWRLAAYMKKTSVCA
jgi:hypothetical protein